MGHLPRILKGAAVNLGGMLGAKVLATLYTVFLARFLTTGEIGLYFLGLTVFELVSALSLFGLDSGMVRFVPIYLARADPAQARGVVRVGARIAGGLGALMALTLLFLAKPVALRLFHESSLELILVALAPAIPFFVVGSVILAGTQGLGRMEFQVYVRHLTEPLVRFAATASLFLVGFRLWGAVLSYTLSTVAGCLLALWFGARLIGGIAPVTTVPEGWRQILFFSLPQTFSRFLLLIIMWTNTLMLGYLSTADAVGLYSIAARTAILGMIVVDAFNVKFAPMISELHEKGARSELAVAFQSVTKWTFALAWPGLLILMVLSREILAVYGAQYRQAWVCLVLLTCGQTVNTLTGPVGQMIIMSGRPWLNFANNLFVALVNVLMTLLLIPAFGMEGAAFATALSIIALNIVRLIEVRALLQVHPYRLGILKPIGAGVVAAGATWLVTHALHGYAALAIGIPMLVVVYAGALYLLGLDAADRFVWAQLRRRLVADRA